MVKTSLLGLILLYCGTLEAFISAKFEKSHHLWNNFTIATEIVETNSKPIRSLVDCAKRCGEIGSCQRFEFCRDENRKPGICRFFSSGLTCLDDGSKDKDKCVCFKIKYVKKEDNSCDCLIGKYGNGASCCESTIIDCTEGQTLNHLKDKGYLITTIKPISYPGEAFPVLCYFADGGFTVMQKRAVNYEEEDFNRTWEEYKFGFGKIDGEHWLGFYKIWHIMQNNGNGRFHLAFDMMNADEQECQFSLNSFQIRSETQKYKAEFLDISYSKLPWCHTYLMVPEDLSPHLVPFATYDYDTMGFGCPVKQQSGWWYGSNDLCSYTNVNGPRNGTGIMLRTNEGVVALKKIQMKLKRK